MVLLKKEFDMKLIVHNSLAQGTEAAPIADKRAIFAGTAAKMAQVLVEGSPEAVEVILRFGSAPEPKTESLRQYVLDHRDMVTMLRGYSIIREVKRYDNPNAVLPTYGLLLTDIGNDIAALLMKEMEGGAPSQPGTAEGEAKAPQERVKA